jgi:hypothetical protein
MVGEGHAVQIPGKTTERAADALPAEPEPTSDDTNAGGRFNDFTPVFPAFFGGRTARSLRRDHFPPPAGFASFHQQPSTLPSRLRTNSLLDRGRGPRVKNRRFPCLEKVPEDFFHGHLERMRRWWSTGSGGGKSLLAPAAAA